MSRAHAKDKGSPTLLMTLCPSIGELAQVGGQASSVSGSTASPDQGPQYQRAPNSQRPAQPVTRQVFFLTTLFVSLC